MGERAGGSRRLDHLTHLEDREVHGDDEAADDDGDQCSDNRLCIGSLCHVDSLS